MLSGFRFKFDLPVDLHHRNCELEGGRRRSAVSRLAFRQKNNLIINGRHGKVKSNRGHVDDL